jgi:prepilin-type N-terminal cleavage/methylation domain-containing protein
MRRSHSSVSGSIVRRRGFSLVEMLIVVVLIGALAAVAIPNFKGFNDKRIMRSAKTRLMIALTTARAAAIQKGQTANAVITGNRITVTVNSAGTSLISPVPLDSLYQVTITPSVSLSQVNFDGRGFPSNLSGTLRFVLTRPNTPADSVCITRFGLIQKTCASL